MQKKNPYRLYKKLKSTMNIIYSVVLLFCLICLYSSWFDLSYRVLF
nr:MAG TPA: hypothetical protein [Bacteriophage sp.]